MGTAFVITSLYNYKTVKQHIRRCSVLAFIRMHGSAENQLTRRDGVVMVFIIIVVLSVMR